MATAVELQMRIKADVKQARTALEQLEKSVAGLGDGPGAGPLADDMDDAARSAEGMTSKMEKFNTVLDFATRAADTFGQVFTATVGRASDLLESTTKAQAVFGEGFGHVQQFVQEFGIALGMSQAEALEATGTFGNLLTSMKLSPELAGQLSTSIVALAGDLASFNNMSPEEALEKLRSGLVGEAEPLRALGVNLNAAKIEAKAFELGLISAGEELSAAAKAQATYALILDETKNAQGDALATGDNYAGSVRRLQAVWADLTASIGDEFLPLATKVAHAATRVLVGLSNIKDVVAPLAREIKSPADALSLLAQGFTALPGPIQLTVGAIVGMTAATVGLNTALKTIAKAKAIYAAIAAALGALSLPVLLIGAVIAGLAVIWMNNWGNMRENTAMQIEAIMGWFDTAREALGRMVDGFFDLMRSATEGFKLAWGVIVTIFTWAWNAIGRTAFESMVAFQRMLIKFWGGVIKGFIKVGTTLFDIVKKTWESLPNVVRGALKFIAKVVDKIFGGLPSGIAKTMLSVVEVVKSAWDGIIGKFQAAGAWIRDNIPGMAGLIGNLTAAWDDGSEGGFMGKLKGWASSTKSFFGDLGSNIKKFVSDTKLSFDGLDMGDMFNIDNFDLEQVEAITGPDTGGAAKKPKKGKGAKKKDPKKTAEELAKTMADIAKKVSDAISTGLDALQQLTDKPLPGREEWTAPLDTLEAFLADAIEMFEDLGRTTLRRLDTSISEGAKLLELGPLTGIEMMIKLVSQAAAAVQAVGQVDLSGAVRITAEQMGTAEHNAEQLVNAIFRLSENFRAAEKETLESLVGAVNAYTQTVQAAAASLTAAGTADFSAVVAINEDALQTAGKNATQLVNQLWVVAQSFIEAEEEPLAALVQSSKAYAAMVQTAWAAFESSKVGALNETVALEKDAVEQAGVNSTLLVNALWKVSENFRGSGAEALADLLGSVQAYAAMVQTAVQALHIPAVKELNASIALSAEALAISEKNATMLVDALWKLAQNFIAAEEGPLAKLMQGVNTFAGTVAAAASALKDAATLDLSKATLLPVRHLSAAIRNASRLASLIEELADRYANLSSEQMKNLGERVALFRDNVAAALSILSSVQAHEMGEIVVFIGMKINLQLRHLKNVLLPRMEEVVDDWDKTNEQAAELKARIEAFGGAISASLGVLSSINDSAEQQAEFLIILGLKLEIQLRHLKNTLIPAVDTVAQEWFEGVTQAENMREGIESFTSVLSAATGALDLLEDMPEQQQEIMTVLGLKLELQLRHLKNTLLKRVGDVALEWHEGVKEVEGLAEAIDAFSGVLNTSLGVLKALEDIPEQQDKLIAVLGLKLELQLRHLKNTLMKRVTAVAEEWYQGEERAAEVTAAISAFNDVLGVSLKTLNLAGALSTTGFAAIPESILDAMADSIKRIVERIITVSVDIDQSTAEAFGRLGTVTSTLTKLGGLLKAIMEGPFMGIRARSVRGFQAAASRRSQLIVEGIKATIETLNDGLKQVTVDEPPAGIVQVIDRIASFYERIIDVVQKLNDVDINKDKVAALIDAAGMLTNGINVDGDAAQRAMANGSINGQGGITIDLTISPTPLPITVNNDVTTTVVVGGRELSEFHELYTSWQSQELRMK